MTDTATVNPDSFGSVATEWLPPSVRTLWRLVAVAEALVLVIAAFVLGIAVDHSVVLVAALVTAVVLGGFRIWMAERRYRHWRWGIDARWVERSSGIFVRTTQVVPRNRVQTLTTRTGPIDRRLGLSSIIVHTAGTHTPNLVIPHLDAATTERIRAELGR